jgi:peptidoglycan/LPS O-acetylase OafA/YrhL
VTLTLAVMVAWLVYSMVEKPCARLRKRLTDW